MCHSPTGGAIRWYHITGMILVLRGEPSMASEEWHELHRPQLALPGAQAPQAPQAPQAMPQPVQGVPAQPPTMKLGVWWIEMTFDVWDCSLGSTCCLDIPLYKSFAFGRAVSKLRNGGHQGQRQLTEGEFFWRNRCETWPFCVVFGLEAGGLLCRSGHVTCLI